MSFCMSGKCHSTAKLEILFILMIYYNMHGHSYVTVAMQHGPVIA